MLEKLRQKPQTGISPEKAKTTIKTIRALAARDALQNINPQLIKLLETEGLFGINEQDRTDAIETLQATQQMPSIDYLDAQPILQALDQEKPFSPKTRMTFNLPFRAPQINRRFAQRLVFTAMAVATAWPTVIYPTYHYHFTEEGIAQNQAKKAEEQRLAAEKIAQDKETTRQKMMETERQTTLGLDPSSPSKDYFWRIRYLPPDPNVEYKPTIGEKNIKLYSDGAALQIPNGNQEERSGMTIQFHERSDGRLVPKLTITTPGGNQSWILRTEPTAEIDSQALEFENIKTGEKKYLEIKLPQPTTKNAQATLMERSEKKPTN